MTINVSAQGIISDVRGESNLLRELGNVASNVSGNATRTSVNIDLQTWILAFRPNGTSNYTPIGSGSFPSAAGGNTSTITHNVDEPVGFEAPVTATSLTYIHRATDEIAVQTSSPTITVNFQPLVYFGPVNNEDWLSGVSDITRVDLFSFATTLNGGTNGAGASQNYRLKLESQGIIDNKITFFTGNTARIFIVAVPSSYDVSAAFSIDNGGQGSILSKYNYFETLSLTNNDGASTTEYKVFCHTQSSPYLSTPSNPVSIEITLQ